MEVLIIGGGGREHALCWKIAQSPIVTRLSFTEHNPGFPPDADIVQGDPVDFAERAGVGLVVVGPEAPLADGLVDRLQERGIAAFGPTRAAARLESSKAFAKSFMNQHRIPTARWSVHEEAKSAHAAVDEQFGGACVVKADGLAAGKGVIVAESATEAHEAVDLVFGGAFGRAGARVLIEECLTGPECSVLALCDGARAVPLLPCRDHKRRFDGDAGPNTGGMGAVCPAPGVDADLVERVRKEVLQPTVDGMAAAGSPFRGVLYAGLMLTREGPKVLEFNVRFGDPECQPLMFMLDQDIMPLLLACAHGRLPELDLQWRDGVAISVVMVSGGYPGAYESGKPISRLPTEDRDLQVFFAGARRDGGRLYTNGGRVLAVTARRSDLEMARSRAYRAVERIEYEGAAWRRDIGVSR